MAHLVATLLGLSVVGAAGVVGLLIFADKFTKFKGTLPLMHLIEPWGFNYKDIPDLTGKTFIVTGANSGLGFGAALELAKHGADVIIAVRSVKKGEEAKKEMGQVKGSLTVMELDNNSLLSVKRFANAFKALGRPLHGLILNAGIMAPPFELTKDGFESQFGVNHIAHFALTKELLPILEKSQPSTIVSVSSLAHWFAPKGGILPDLKAINDPSKYNPHTWYGQSKLANILFVRELNRRIGADKKVFVNAVHPGGVQGNLTRHMVGDNSILKIVDNFTQKLMYWRNQDGALTVLSPAVSPAVVKDNIRGQYFVPIGRPAETSAYASDPKLAQRLWEMTENILKEKGWDSMQ
jgi:NAD(P)-dependent dehydrogenase (short-subunit alcohol dehydrogenase family)